MQRGSGLGSIFAGLFRNVVKPFARTLFHAAKKPALHAAIGTLSDVASGESLKSSAKKRLSKATKSIIKNVKKRRLQEQKPLFSNDGNRIRDYS